MLKLVPVDLPKEQERQHRALIASTTNELAKAYPSNGVWTPTIGGSVADGTHTYTEQTGYYYRIGRRVFADFVVILSAKDAALSGSVFVKGLPFTSKDTGTSISGVAISYYTAVNLSAGKSQLTAVVAANTTSILLIECGDNVSHVAVTDAAIGNTTIIGGTASYEISDDL